jgi:hypothetical protein
MAQPTLYTRQDYMNKICTHGQYYGQFSEYCPYIIEFVVNNIGKKAIMASECPHFNDIPLKKWDALHFGIRNLVGNIVQQCNGKNAGYSLSDSVCIAKQAARIFKNAQSEVA